MMMELLNEEGCNNGVVNVINGENEDVKLICDKKDIKDI